MNLSSLSLVVLCALCSVFTSCAEHNIPVEHQCLSNETISFSSDVEEIVISNCAVSGCHDGTNGAERNWLIFSNFQSHASEVRHRITLPIDHPEHMPRLGSLTADEIQTIICWVDQGAKED